VGVDLSDGRSSGFLGRSGAGQPSKRWQALLGTHDQGEQAAGLYHGSGGLVGIADQRYFLEVPLSPAGRLVRRLEKLTGVLLASNANLPPPRTFTFGVDHTPLRGTTMDENGWVSRTHWRSMICL
jgi:hypothetical protein